MKLLSVSDQRASQSVAHHFVSAQRASQGVAKHRARRLALAALLIGLVASGCFELDFDFDSDGSKVDSVGCQPGTPGKNGLLSFKFLQNGYGSLAAADGKAFAVGTTTRFGVSRLTDEALPGLSPGSGDSDVLWVSTDDASDEDRPYLVEFLRPGTAAVQMLRDDDGTVYDEVDLRVVEPQGLVVVADHAQSGLLHFDNQLEAPGRIVLAPWSSCRLLLHLVDAEGSELYGLYTEQASPTAFVDYREDASQGFDFLGMAGLTRRLEAVAEGTETLTLTGPGGVEARLDLEITTAPELERLAVSVGTPLGESMVVGTTATAFAVGVTPEGDPAFGYRVAWVSDNPDVVGIVPGSGGPDTAEVELRAPGWATLSARWLGDSSVVGEVELQVEAE
ncbi:MAG: hypothetical protein ABI333_05705 [bacterium]